MVYCKKCARLLDEDVRFCPYCNQEDENFTEETDLMDRLRQIDEQIAKNQWPAETPAYETPAATPEAADTATTDSIGEAVDAITPPAASETGDSSAAASAAKPPKVESSRANNAPKKEYVDPRSITVETTSYGSRIPPGGAAASERTPSTALYVGLILLAIFMTLPGMIVGIVYMTNASAAYRKMGLVVLLVSVGMILLYIFGCCGLSYAIGAFATDGMLETLTY